MLCFQASLHVHNVTYFSPENPSFLCSRMHLEIILKVEMLKVFSDEYYSE